MIKEIIIFALRILIFTCGASILFLLIFMVISTIEDLLMEREILKEKIIKENVEKLGLLINPGDSKNEDL